MIIYEILTGMAPPDRIDGAPPNFPPRTLNPDLFKLVLDCCQNDAMLRPSASLLAQKLQAVWRHASKERSLSTSRPLSLAFREFIETLLFISFCVVFHEG